MSISPPAIVAGRYQLLRQLPGGNFANTFVARDRQAEQTVVVKLLHEAYMRDPTFVRRFEREARLALAVEHPNSVSVIDTGWDGAQLYLVMEWVNGQDLKQLIIEQAPLALHQALSIVLDVLAGLEAIHAAGIIHRDIKPQNILLDHEGRAMIADFGIARAASDTGITHTGQAVGTAAYMAPEQASGGLVSAASDLYAVGVVLFELVTGQLPFTGTNAVRVMYQHVNAPPPRPRDLNRRIPIWLEQVILTALAKHPDERFTDVAALRAALLAAAQEPTLEVPVPSRYDPDGSTLVSHAVAMQTIPASAGTNSTQTLAPATTTARSGPAHSFPGWGVALLVALVGFALAGLVIWHGADRGAGVRERVAGLTKQLKQATTSDIASVWATNTPTSAPTEGLAMTNPQQVVSAPSVTDAPTPVPTPTAIPTAPPAAAPPTATLSVTATTSRSAFTATTALLATGFQRELTVPSDAVEGVTVDIPTSGRYAIQIVAGAYTTWPDGRNWRTIVYLYRDRKISWRDCRGYGYIEPCDPDAMLGQWEVTERNTAERLGMNATPIVAEFQAGARVRFVAIDERSSYGDNPTGGVTIRISAIQ